MKYRPRVLERLQWRANRDAGSRVGHRHEIRVLDAVAYQRFVRPALRRMRARLVRDRRPSARHDRALLAPYLPIPPTLAALRARCRRRGLPAPTHYLAVRRCRAADTLWPWRLGAVTRLVRLRVLDDRSLARRTTRRRRRAPRGGGLRVVRARPLPTRVGWFALPVRLGIGPAASLRPSRTARRWALRVAGFGSPAAVRWSRRPG